MILSILLRKKKSMTLLLLLYFTEFENARYSSNLTPKTKVVDYNNNKNEHEKFFNIIERKKKGTIIKNIKSLIYEKKKRQKYNKKVRSIYLEYCFIYISK